MDADDRALYAAILRDVQGTGASGSCSGGSSAASLGSPSSSTTSSEVHPQPHPLRFVAETIEFISQCVTKYGVDSLCFRYSRIPLRPSVPLDRVHRFSPPRLRPFLLSYFILSLTQL